MSMYVLPTYLKNQQNISTSVPEDLLVALLWRQLDIIIQFFLQRGTSTLKIKKITCHQKSALELRCFIGTSKI